MSGVVSRSKPDLKLREELRAEIGCPNCDNVFDLDANEVERGYTIECENCGNRTYHPFDKPWYKRKKLFWGYVASVLVSLVVGFLSNAAWDYTSQHVSLSTDSTQT